MSREDLQAEFDFIQKNIDNLIDTLKEDFSPAMVAAAFISRGVFIAKTCMTDSDPKINKLIVESVTSGKEAALKALEET